MSRREFAAAGRLLALSWRQNRLLLLLTILLPLVFAYGAASSNIAVLQTPAELQSYIAQSRSSPVTTSLLGPILADTMAGVTSWRIRFSAAMFAAIFSIVIVSKQTRKEEELGRLELLRSGAVGRKAALSAALLPVFVANLGGGVMLALGYAAAGFPLLGSLTAGLAMALVGCAFAALAAVAAQLTPSARTAGAIAYGSLGGLALLQVIGNLQPWLGGVFYFSPFSWATLARPFAGERFAVFGSALLFVGLATLVAFALAVRRDLGDGPLAAAKGRAAARPGLNNPLALAWRLQRGPLLGWMAGYALSGAVLGSLVLTIQAMFQNNSGFTDWVTRLGGSSTAFLVFAFYILAQVATAYAIISALQLRDEEVELRAEVMLANSTSRSRWAASHLLFAFAGSALVMTALGLGAGCTAGAVLQHGGLLTSVLLASLARVPAIWLVASLTVLLLGWLPRLTAGISWAVVGLLIVIEFLWELGLASDALFRLSPFSYVHPAHGTQPAAILGLLLAAALLTALGLVGLRRREIGH